MVGSGAAGGGVTGALAELFAEGAVVTGGGVGVEADGMPQLKAGAAAVGGALRRLPFAAAGVAAGVVVGTVARSTRAGAGTATVVGGGGSTMVVGDVVVDVSTTEVVVDEAFRASFGSSRVMTEESTAVSSPPCNEEPTNASPKMTKRPMRPRFTTARTSRAESTVITVTRMSLAEISGRRSGGYHEPSAPRHQPCSFWMSVSMISSPSDLP